MRCCSMFCRMRLRDRCIDRGRRPSKPDHVCTQPQGPLRHAYPFLRRDRDALAILVIRGEGSSPMLGLFRNDDITEMYNVRCLGALFAFGRFFNTCCLDYSLSASVLSFSFSPLVCVSHVCPFQRPRCFRDVHETSVRP